MILERSGEADQGGDVIATLHDFDRQAQFVRLILFILGAVLTTSAGQNSPALLARAAGTALTAVDPGVMFTVGPLADHLDASLVQERTVARLAGFFGGLALLLAALGLYGTTAYSVVRRRPEIGIRLAPSVRHRRRSCGWC